MKGIAHLFRADAIASLRTLAPKLKRLVALFAAASIVIFCSSRAAAQDEEYVNIYSAIQQADSLNDGKQPEAALAKYREADNALRSFQMRYPNWNKGVVSYRLNYVAQKIAALTAKPVEPTPPPSTAPPTIAPRPRPGIGVPTSLPKTTEVKLLEPGAEPRKELRLHPKVGDKQNLTVVIRISIDMKIAGQGEVAKAPTINLTMDTTVKDVSADGDVTYDIVMGNATTTDEPGTTAEMAAAMKASLGKLKGITGTQTVTSRGVVKATNFKVPEGADPELSQAMDQIKDSFSEANILLPEEPVGPGARWQATMPVESKDLPLAQSVTYQLISVEGDRITAKTVVAQTSVSPGTQKSPMAGKMSGRGTGDLTYDLTRVSPSKATFDLHTELTMGTDPKQSLSMKMDLKIEMTGK